MKSSWIILVKNDNKSPNIHLFCTIWIKAASNNGYALNKDKTRKKIKIHYKKVKIRLHTLCSVLTKKLFKSKIGIPIEATQFRF